MTAKSLENKIMNDKQLLRNHFVKISQHKFWVMVNLMKISWALLKRGWRHDFSKYGETERTGFALFTPNLAKHEYMSDAYKADMNNEKFQAALQHHYRKNAHHPEAHEDGIKGMSLLDQLEMLADWAASVRRQKNGDLKSSINKNADRFEYGEFFKQTLDKTAIEAKLFKFHCKKKVLD